MKRVLFFLSFLVMSTVCFGQEESEHMTFMGIPVEGSGYDFRRKLLEKGFEPHPDEGALIGEFEGYVCLIVLDCEKENLNNTITGYSLLFLPEQNWEGLSSTYYNLKKILSSKYGEPINEVEEFERSVNDSKSKYYEVKEGRCNYWTTYLSEKELVIVNIRYIEDWDTCFVVIYYADRKYREEHNFDDD